MRVKVTLEIEVNGKRVVKSAEADGVCLHPSAMMTISDRLGKSLEEETARNLLAAISRNVE